jgi:hypothetical protein
MRTVAQAGRSGDPTFRLDHSIRSSSRRVMGFAFALVLAVGARCAEASQGFLLDWQPRAIDHTLAAGTATSVALQLAFFNTGDSTLDLVVYVQDDPACPPQASAHGWIPYGPGFGSVPAGVEARLDIQIPLAAVDLLPGLYQTHLCVVADADVPTLVAVPVRLQVMPADYLFAHGFESLAKRPPLR